MGHVLQSNHLVGPKLRVCSKSSEGQHKIFNTKVMCSKEAVISGEWEKEKDF